MEQVRKWPSIENSIRKQKSQSNWMEGGDENSSFFHASLKAKRSINIVDKVVEHDGTVSNEEVAQHFIEFYKLLLGTLLPLYRV